MECCSSFVAGEPYFLGKIKLTSVIRKRKITGLNMCEMSCEPVAVLVEGDDEWRFFPIQEDFDLEKLYSVFPHLKNDRKDI